MIMVDGRGRQEEFQRVQECLQMSTTSVIIIATEYKKMHDLVVGSQIFEQEISTTVTTINTTVI